MPRLKFARHPKRRRILALFAACVALALFLDYALYPPGETSAPRFDKGENAVWLSFDFAQGRAKETSQHLASRMEAQGMRDLFRPSAGNSKRNPSHPPRATPDTSPISTT